MAPKHDQATLNSGTSRRAFLGMLGATGALGLPSLVACTSEPATSGVSGRAGGRYRIIHPSKNPLVVWAVTYLAEDEGYYRDEGLEISRVLLGGGPAGLTGLISGAGDVLNSTAGETLAATAKGQKFKVLMGHTNNMPGTFVLAKAVASKLGVSAESPLDVRRQALAKLPRGRYGITSPGSQTDGFTRLALKQAGVDPDKNAQLIPLQTAGNSLAALSQNRIDGFIAVPPAGETAIEQFGAVPLLYAQDGDIRGADNLQGMCVVARAQDVESSGDLYAAAIRAEAKAMQQINDDQASTGALLRKKRFADLDEAVWKQTWSRMGPALKSPMVSAESLSAWLDNGLVDGGKVTSAGISFDELIDLDNLSKVLSSLNWKPGA